MLAVRRFARSPRTFRRNRLRVQAGENHRLVPETLEVKLVELKETTEGPSSDIEEGRRRCLRVDQLLGYALKGHAHEVVGLLCSKECVPVEQCAA